jgi:hypothetical protein
MTGFANPPRRLALRTSTPNSVPSMRNSLETTLHGIPKRLVATSLSNLLAGFHHQWTGSEEDDIARRRAWPTGCSG